MSLDRSWIKAQPTLIINKVKYIKSMTLVRFQSFGLALSVVVPTFCDLSRWD